jgi:hypothetical protein
MTITMMTVSNVFAVVLLVATELSPSRLHRLRSEDPADGKIREVLHGDYRSGQGERGGCCRSCSTSWDMSNMDILPLVV